MDTDGNKIEPNTLDELCYAEEAVFEEKDTGSTARRCIRCGGRYRLLEVGNSYEITCDGCDFKETVRGL